jgi:hypothetical protein
MIVMIHKMARRMKKTSAMILRCFFFLSAFKLLKNSWRARKIQPSAFFMKWNTQGFSFREGVMADHQKPAISRWNSGK